MFSLKAFCISIIVIIVNILAMIVISATRLQEKPTRGAVPMKELLLSSQPCTKRTCKPLLSSLPSTIMMVKTNLSCANTLRRLSLCPHSSPRTSPHGNVQQHFRVFKWMCHIQGVFFSLALPLNTLSTKKFIKVRLGVSWLIYVNLDSPNLGLPYFNFLEKKVRKSTLYDIYQGIMFLCNDNILKN